MNKNRNVGITLIKLACYWLILFSFMPFMQYYLHFPISSLPLILLIIGTITTRDYKKISEFSIVFVLILIYSIVLYFGVWQEIAEFVSKLWSLVVFWLAVLLTISLGVIKNNKFFKNILYFCIIIIAITCITTIIGLYKEPMASRYLATGRNDLYNLNLYLKSNIGGYGFVYSLVLLIPFMIYVFKNKIIDRMIILILLALFYFCIIKSQYTIAIVASFTYVPLFFIRLNKRNFIFFIIFAALLVLLLKDVIGDILIYIADKVDYLFIKARFYQLASILQGTNIEGSDDRFFLYMMSLRAFLSSPILGRLSLIFEKLPIGRHSEFLDLLGGTGLFGLCLFLLLFILSYRYIFKSKKEAKKNVFLTVTIMSYFLLGSINTMHLPMIFPIFFVWYCIFSFNKEEEKNENIVAV